MPSSAARTLQRLPNSLSSMQLLHEDHGKRSSCRDNFLTTSPPPPAARGCSSRFEKPDLGKKWRKFAQRKIV
eukprot:scaffold9009_cov130-Isochrysis_galbana.AAC.10